MIVNFGFSQSNTRLQGPAAKNTKPWHKKYKKSKVVYIKSKEFLKGPAAKNAKPWHKEDGSQVYVEMERINRHKLKGPQAKNFKPWMLFTPNEVDTVVIKERASSKLRGATE